MLDTIITTPEVDAKLAKFYEMHMNAELNLTAVKEREEFYIKHYLDSVYYFKNHMKPYGTLADIGSGGGFPGVVLAIFYPSIKITLIESVAKKCRFLESAVAELDLKNVRVLNTRAENVKNKTFDIITARGVASVLEIIKNTYSMSKSGTTWILYKGEKTTAELEEAAVVIKNKELHVETIRIETPFTRTYCVLNR